MAKNRYINTAFWDDNYIETLTPIERYLFLYFLTNDKTDLCGIYEISLKRIITDTGLKKKDILTIIDKFTREKKMYYIDMKWLYIKNFLKHQKINPSVKAGITRSLANVPKEIMEKKTEFDTACHSLSQPGTPYLTLPYLTLPIPNPTKTPKAVAGREETNLQKVINYFFTLKKWDWKNPKYKKIYGRYTVPARDLLDLNDQNVAECKRQLKVLFDWAESRKLDWSIETVLKKWFDLPQLQPREKKPKWQGQPLFKDHTGRWKIITHNGDVKVFNNPESEIEYE